MFMVHRNHRQSDKKTSIATNQRDKPWLLLRSVAISMAAAQNVQANQYNRAIVALLTDQLKVIEAPIRWPPRNVLFLIGLSSRPDFQPTASTCIHLSPSSCNLNPLRRQAVPLQVPLERFRARFQEVGYAMSMRQWSLGSLFPNQVDHV